MAEAVKRKPDKIVEIKFPNNAKPVRSFGKATTMDPRDLLIDVTRKENGKIAKIFNDFLELTSFFGFFLFFFKIFE